MLEVEPTSQRKWSKRAGLGLSFRRHRDDILCESFRKSHVRRVCRCGRRRAGLRSENVPRVRFADSGELRQRKRSGEVRLRSTVSSSDLSANCQSVAARWFGRQLFQTRLRSPGNTRRRNRRPLHRRSWYTGEFQPARRRYASASG